ncbi:hypothetical protein [Helicobacter trogontum]
MLVILTNSDEGLAYNYANLMDAGKDNPKQVKQKASRNMCNT